MQTEPMNEPACIPKNFITQNELANLFGISPQAAWMWMKHNGIETFRTSNKAALAPKQARSFFNKRNVTFRREILAFQMLKGGSTKTSSAFNLAVRLNQYGARVLCFDIDLQGNLTDAFGVSMENRPVLYHLLLEKSDERASINEVLININDGLDLIPSDFENSSIDFLMNHLRLDTRSVIQSIIEPIRENYDFVIIDCNPSLSNLNISAALASDRIIIPVNPDSFSRKGLKKTIAELERISATYKKRLNYSLLFTLYDGREASSQKYLIEYGKEYDGKLISTVIRRNADVKNSIDRKQSIFNVKNAPAREDFDLFAREILGIRELTSQLSN